MQSAAALLKLPCSIYACHPTPQARLSIMLFAAQASRPSRPGVAPALLCSLLAPIFQARVSASLTCRQGSCLTCSELATLQQLAHHQAAADGPGRSVHDASRTALSFVHPAKDGGQSNGSKPRLPDSHRQQCTRCTLQGMTTAASSTLQSSNATLGTLPQH